MNDTLATNDKVIVTDMLYTPHNNDIVVISHGAEYEKPIINRVIATEGQTVKLDYENDRIIVDGIELDEPYIKGTTFSGNQGDNVIPEVIPEGLAPEELVELACRGRGWLLSGGRVDSERGAAVILDEYRAGKAGKLTIERVEG